ncbi:MAG: lytic transglycosylase domain-containing protein, partial [Alphaproteobacteria bacterium]|nr:lytic transglycosylase domain-containing protein [Alphaproteobacteria bacterium]
AKGDTSAAYQLASSHKQVEGTSFAEAEWLSGWIALRFLHDGEAALNHFTRLYGNMHYPVSRSRAAYYAARAAQILGRSELAQSWYAKAAEFPTTFHGQLAAARFKNRVPPSLPPDPLPATRKREQFNTRDLVRIVRLLGEIGEYKRIEPFVIHLNDLVSTPGERAMVADLAHDNGRPDVGVKIARQAIRNGVYLVSRGYPIPAQFDREHPKTPLLLALMRQESSFDSFAESHVGARGLMQIMPATAKNVARQLNVPYSKTRLMTDPRYNLMLGRTYIYGLLDKYGDSYVLALAAYNAGP